MDNTKIKIVPFKSDYKDTFKSLNLSWIEEYFTVEPIDSYVLENPEETILNAGGVILFAVLENDVIGTVALKLMNPGVFELTKMAVDKNRRGLGAGKKLCEAAISKARDIGASEIILYSNTALKPAIQLYRDAGFTELPTESGGYARADIKMNLKLD